MAGGYSSGTDVIEVNGKQAQWIVPTWNTDGENDVSGGNRPINAETYGHTHDRWDND